MRIVLLTHWLCNRGGGVSAVVQALARSLARLPGREVHVCGLVADSTEISVQDWCGVNVHPIERRDGLAIGYVPEMDELLARLRPNIVHLHGLWTYASIAALCWRGRTMEGRLVISPHGMLEPWALSNSGLKKRIAGALFQRGVFRRADLLHGLTHAEVGEIVAYFAVRWVGVIPNGVDLPGATKSQCIEEGRRRLLYLGRLHPKKNLGFLLEAWAAAESATEGWLLEIAGWDQAGTEVALRRQVVKLGLRASVNFLGPQFGAAKDATYRRADAFVLPSLSEGLPLVVLEAWSHGLPVLMTDACNLPDGFTAGAAQRLRTDTVADGARDLVDFLNTRPEKWCAMGSASRHLVRQAYLWDVIAGMFDASYAWTLGRASKPDFVHGV